MNFDIKTGKCVRHGESACPSCLTYSLGDAHDDCARLRAALDEARRIILEARRHVPHELGGNSVWPSALHNAMDEFLSRHPSGPKEGTK